MRKQKGNRKIWEIIFIMIIISLSISPAFATSEIDNRNFLLIICMAIGAMIFIINGEIKGQPDYVIFFLILIIFATQIVFHFNRMRWSSILFTFMFFIYFLVGIKTALKANLQYNELCKLFKSIIYAYVVVLLIQQFCVILGLPIFNKIGESENIWKLNALSAEPSHTARYIGVLMYSYLNFKDRIQQKSISFSESFNKNILVWLSFLWIMLTTASGTALIVLCLIISRYLTKRNIIFGSIALFVIFTVGINSDISSLRRSTTFLSAVASGDSTNMIMADHSASIRIVPFLLCIERINPLTLQGWIGEGGGSTSSWMSDMIPGVPDDFSGGAMACYTLEYGLLVGGLFLYFSLKCCYDKHHKLCTTGLWLMCIVLIGINSQIAWFCMLMLYLDKYYYKTYENKSILRLT